MKAKRIISLILALCLTLGALFSLSSCLSAARFFLGVDGEQSGEPNAPGVPEDEGGETD